MRILIVNTLYYPDKIGGAEVSVQLLAETLVEQGHDVSVVCIARGRVPRKESVNGVHVYRIRLFNVYWPFDGRDKGRLSSLMEKIPVALVLDSRAPLYGAAHVAESLAA